MSEDLGEKCAVFGVFDGNTIDVARITFFGLFALQHRGQESSGISTSDGKTIRTHRAMGLVAQAFSEETIVSLKGNIAVGHNRYSTAGGSHLDCAQPLSDADQNFVLVHNGNLPTTTALQKYLKAHGARHEHESDSACVVEAISVAMKKEGMDLVSAVKTVYPLIVGSFSILIMGKDRLIAIRDECGIRPLALARLKEGWVFSSETCALATIGATFEREVQPGEMVVIDVKGVHSEQLATARPMLDAFEFVYFARHDSELLGKSVYQVRKNFGIQLAKERRIEADVVIPVPETAIPAAIGYSQQSGIPFEMGLAKNRYIQRTFIAPEQHLRELGVRMKLTPILQIIKGKRVVVLDDSIVRGTTSKQIVKMLFDYGASEVHFLASSPPVKFPDFYGIDMSKITELIAACVSVEEVQKFIGSTSLQYLSLEGMVSAIGVPQSQLNTSCFTGEYPIDIGERKSETVCPIL